MDRGMKIKNKNINRGALVTLKQPKIHNQIIQDVASGKDCEVRKPPLSNHHSKTTTRKPPLAYHHLQTTTRNPLLFTKS